MDPTRLTQLREYVKQSRDAGLSYEQVQAALTSGGWTADEVNANLPGVWAEAAPGAMPVATPVVAAPVSYPAAGGTGAGGYQAAPHHEGFFGALFDLSFDHFVVTRVIKVLYVIGIIVAALYGVGAFISILGAGFKVSSSVGVLSIFGGIIAAPLTFFLMVLMFRIYMEMIIVLFRIYENVAEINERAR